MKKKLLLFFGGRSAEHEISLLSARNVAAAIDQTKYELILVGISQSGSWFHFESPQIFDQIKKLEDQKIPAGAQAVSLICKNGKPELFFLGNQKSIAVDVAFPVLHGTFGEDGCIQGLFKMMNLAFVGCGVFASSASMDKEVMKRLFTEAQIPNAKYLLVTHENLLSFDEIAKKLGLPFFIKPANMGSSVGVHKIKTAADYKEKIQDSLKYDHKVLAEEFIEGREIECSVMGLNHSPDSSLCGEIMPLHEFYSYEAKYLDDEGARLRIPAEIPADIQKTIQSLARKTFSVMGCEGLARVDFFLKKSGEAYVNELNTMPGFTKISMYPKMWEATGVSPQKLIADLIQLALDVKVRESKIQTQFPGA